MLYSKRILYQIQQGMERLRLAAPDVFNSMGLPSLPPGLLPPPSAATTNGGVASPSPASPSGQPSPGQADAFSQFMTQVVAPKSDFVGTQVSCAEPEPVEPKLSVLKSDWRLRG